MKEQEQLQNQMNKFINLMSGNKEYYLTYHAAGLCKTPSVTDGADWTFLDWKLSSDGVVILWTRANNKI